ncbi:MAG TPA: serine/threonine-protein kinase [Planctomycetota bacterium]|nr:serine/threonine-protein kinase [Planctomycetota bacterium]
MSDLAKRRTPATSPAETAGWEESLSREIDSLAHAADQLARTWETRFGDGAFENPAFLGTYQKLIEGHFILSVLAGVQRKTESDAEPSRPPFEERFRNSLQGILDGTPVLDSVRPSVLNYLGLAVSQARQEKASGLLVDPEPIVRILRFTKQLSDLPALSGFRVDLLDRFPSSLEDASGASTERPGRPTSPSGSRLRPGHRIRQYEIVKLLGAGGFAEVYLAYHSGLQEHRAIKAFVSVPTQGPEHDRVRSAFYEEAQTQAKLKHENIVQVHEVDDQGGLLILIMEYVEGQNLRRLIDERRLAQTHLSPDEIVTIALDVGRGLAYAHSLKIIHRDLKPENILIDPAGVAKISDFGLAKPLNDSGQRRTTRMGNLIGTPEYMAPEQVFSDVYDHRIDLYSFGAVLYHLALGEPPFDGKDPWVIFEKHKNEAPVPLSTLRADFPEELDRIVLRLLAKHPDERYGSAEEVVRDLEACRASVSSVRPRRGAGSRRPWIFAASLALAVAAAATFGAKAWRAPAIPAIAKEQRTDPAALAKGPKIDAPQLPSGDPSEKPPAPPERVPAHPGREASTVAALRTPPPPPPTPVAVPIRQQLAQFPLDAEEASFVGGILEAFSKHRPELLKREYGPLLKELEGLTSGESGTFRAGMLEAAEELARLSEELVGRRWQELSESKGEFRLTLDDGTVVAGTVAEADDRTITLADGRGGKVGVDRSRLASDDVIRGRTMAQAEVAYQAASGDAGEALSQARALEKSTDRAALWVPAIVRLARLALGEQIRATLAQAEAPLSRKVPRSGLEKSLSRYPEVLSTLRALSDAKADVLSIYPFLEGEFRASEREGAALELLLSGAASKVLSTAPGTDAERLASTLVQADFIGALEAAHEDLIAKRGWLNNGWELRPDEPGIPERTQFWDLLDGGGCVLRDPKGPRSLIMGRPHPRCSEGVLIRYEFEPLGEDRASAEWRFNLRREGGGASYLLFRGETVSLRASMLGAAVPDEILLTAKVPSSPGEPRTHDCLLIPGEQFQVFLDGILVATVKKEDALLPAQPSLVVKGGKLSIRSIQVLKKPSK